MAVKSRNIARHNLCDSLALIGHILDISETSVSGISDMLSKSSTLTQHPETTTKKNMLIIVANGLLILTPQGAISPNVAICFRLIKIIYRVMHSRIVQCFI